MAIIWFFVINVLGYMSECRLVKRNCWSKMTEESLLKQCCRENCEENSRKKLFSEQNQTGEKMAFEMLRNQYLRWTRHTEKVLQNEIEIACQLIGNVYKYSFWDYFDFVSKYAASYSSTGQSWYIRNLYSFLSCYICSTRFVSIYSRPRLKNIFGTARRIRLRFKCLHEMSAPISDEHYLTNAILL